MKSRPSIRNVNSFQKAVSCTRVAGSSSEHHVWPIYIPAATKAHTPETPARSAGIQAAKGISSEKVISTRGSLS